MHGASYLFFLPSEAMILFEILSLGLAVNRWIIMICIQLILVALGLFLDEIGIILLCVPIFIPIITELGFDPVWFGILFLINAQMDYITPPFGYTLFYLKGVAPEGVTMGDIYRSVIPFVIIQAIGLALCMIFPQIIFMAAKYDEVMFSLYYMAINEEIRPISVFVINSRYLLLVAAGNPALYCTDTKPLSNAFRLAYCAQNKKIAPPSTWQGNLHITSSGQHPQHIPADPLKLPTQLPCP